MKNHQLHRSSRTRRLALPFLAAALASAQLASAASTIVLENFGGTGSNLNGTTAETFASGITTAGGSSTWVAATTFKDNGSIVDGNNQSAYLNMGSYINSTKGTTSGMFIASTTMTPITGGSWAGFGFFESNAPNTAANFTNAAAVGMGFFIYRNTGELDGFGGPQSGNLVDGGTTKYTTDLLLTIVLDLTPGGGYNGTDNFGTVSFIRGDVDTGTSLGSYTHTVERSFGSIGLSVAGNTTTGTFSGFQLTQIPEPSSAVLLGGLGMLCLLRRRR